MIVCHVILQDHVIKWSCDFMDRSQPYRQDFIKVSCHPAKLDGHRHCVSGDMFLVCLAILMS